MTGNVVLARAVIYLNVGIESREKQWLRYRYGEEYSRLANSAPAYIERANVVPFAPRGTGVEFAILTMDATADNRHT
jgi:hypothetical protein